MKIGIAGPVTLPMLAKYVNHGHLLPRGYEFPMLANLVEEFIRKGHRVIYYTLDSSTVKPTVFRGESLTLHIGRYRTQKRARDFFAQERADLVREMLSDPGEIIHAQWTYEFALAALETGLPCLVTAHDAPLRILRYDHSPYRMLRSLLSFPVIRKAKFLSAVSPYIANDFIYTYRYPGQVRVIPNGIPGSILIQDGDKMKDVNRKISFASILNGWSKLKNTTTLLSAFSRLREEFPEAELWLFGDGHGPGQSASQWAVAKKLERGVKFIGKMQHLDMLKLIEKNVDILVHPSFEESFGMAIIEAMALGVPVIGGDKSGGVPYVLGHGEAGCLADVKSASALAGAMVRLAENQDLRETLGKKGLAYVRDHFTLDKVTDEYMMYYHHVLQS